MAILLLFWTVFFLIAALRAHRPFAFTSLFDQPDEHQTALLLTAHPDDEAMFFTPTVTLLVSQGWDVRALCLSTGRLCLSEQAVQDTYRQAMEMGWVLRDQRSCMKATRYWASPKKTSLCWMSRGSIPHVWRTELKPGGSRMGCTSSGTSRR